MDRRFHLGRARLAHLWELLRTSYWFVPTLMTAGSIGLSAASVYLDEQVDTRFLRMNGWIWGGSPEGAREVLSTIAGSMITVAGVAFSITIVSLTLASSQFGPRLLRSFVRDFGNQVVLGTFVSTFVYCLLVLRTVRGGPGEPFVPHVSVTLGVVFALASLGVLIYFIHHVAHVIQAEHLIGSVAHELRGAIVQMFPRKLGEPGPAASGSRDLAPPAAEGEGGLVEADRSGYLQTVDHDGLMSIACGEDLVLELLQNPGRFVVEGSALVRVWPAGRVNGELADRIRETFILGRRRTPTQDPEYAVHSLVEIGVRALSPGINDPFSAMTCLDWLGAALSELAGREIPSRFRCDGEGRLRVIAGGTTFCEMADAAFNQIRQYGRGSVSVLLRLLDTLAAVSEHAGREEDRACLRTHAEKVIRDAREALSDGLDLQEVERRHAAALQALGG